VSESAGNGVIILALLGTAIGLMTVGAVTQKLRNRPAPKSRQPVYALANLKQSPPTEDSDEYSDTIVVMQQEPMIQVRL
jgi:hypothetical protein